MARQFADCPNNHGPFDLNALRTRYRLAFGLFGGAAGSATRSLVMTLLGGAGGAFAGDWLARRCPDCGLPLDYTGEVDDLASDE